MHQLDRTSVPAPACLGHYRHGTHSWDSVTAVDKQAIRDALEQLQGRRCAYCECDLPADNHHAQHIEHFVQKGRVPQVTFDWHNLFWSCTHPDSCGKFKDEEAAPYADADLIKPDVDDPEVFFRFGPKGTITILPAPGTPAHRKASETIQVFNLNHGRLRKARAQATLGYIKEAETLLEYVEAGMRDQVVQHFQAEFAYTRDLPFATAIKHTLLPF